MKKLLLAITILVPVSLYALEVPALKGRINDYAGMLKPQTIQGLDATLSALEKSDSTQIAILTIPSLEGEDLEEYTIRVAEKWKIGQKGLDNGAIVLISKNDRKIRIEVGRGLEGKLTDLSSGRIIRDIIRPKFKAGDFDGGLVDGVNAIVSAVKGEFKASDKKGTKSSDDDSPPFLLFAVIFLILVVLLSGIKKIFGGIGGAVAAPAMYGISAASASIPGLAIAGVAGFAAGMIIAMIARNRLGSSDGGGGGMYWGGGGGGGSSDSFSGGGGDFGGGGASDDW